MKKMGVKDLTLKIVDIFISAWNNTNNDTGNDTGNVI